MSEHRHAEKIEPLFLAWAKARADRLFVRAHRLTFRCEEWEAGEPDVGVYGRDSCFRLWSHVTDEWCRPCASRQPIFEREKELKCIEKIAFRKLTALANHFR